jgi:hypothetical protein
VLHDRAIYESFSTLDACYICLGGHASHGASAVEIANYSSDNAAELATDCDSSATLTTVQMCLLT